LGCGRGEWLEVLKEEGLKAHGVDINRILVEQCREYGLDVVEGELIHYLQSLPGSSHGAVTGFHIIEHLELKLLLNLIDETIRILKPGSVAIFETPNPENVLVGSCNFYLDPTHNKPLPSPMMKFLAEARGLCRVEILNLHPRTNPSKINGSDLVERFNEYFYGPQDYALIGFKG
jgi:O-antigen chain-terminating methyltransferase